VVEKPLFLPAPWLTDASARRRTRGQVPDDRGFQPKPQGAAAMWRELRDEGGLPFKSVVADGWDGHRPELLQAIEACPGMISVVSLPSDTRCWRQGPVLAATHDREKGEGRSTRVVAQTEKAPMTVKAVAHSLHDGLWSRRHVSEGTPGPMVYALTKRQVTRCTDGQPDQTVWLVMKRTLGEPPSSWYDISNAPVSTRWPLVVW
jgi:hypothetical protein